MEPRPGADQSAPCSLHCLAAGAVSATQARAPAQHAPAQVSCHTHKQTQPTQHTQPTNQGNMLVAACHHCAKTACPPWCVAVPALRNGQYSTAAAVLEELQGQHALPGIILEHRKLSKLMTGFSDALTGLAVKEAQRQGALATQGTAGAACWAWAWTRGQQWVETPVQQLSRFYTLVQGLEVLSNGCLTALHSLHALTTAATSAGSLFQQ